MNTYTIIVHGSEGNTERKGTARQLMELYYSNIDNTRYDLVGMKANLNKRDLFECLNRLA